MMHAATADGIDAYLFDLARRTSMQQREIASIDLSRRTLSTRLSAFFLGEISTHFIFGSAQRGTMLPRAHDENSDVDYMVVWQEAGVRPQAYLDRLRRFVENSYSRSEVKQSSPTIVLELDHIKFELVPALRSWNSYVIPSGPDNWRSTDPAGFSAQLNQLDRAHSGLIRPTVRIAKTWNAKAGHVFESFDLEQRIAAMNFDPRGGLRKYVVTALAGLSAVHHREQWRHMATTRLLNTLSSAIEYERNFYRVTAAQQMRGLFE